MTRRVYIPMLLLFTACGTPPTPGTAETTIRDTTHISTTPGSNDSSKAGDPNESDNATYFVVIADTGQRYVYLRQKMFNLNKELHIPIDTMGRYYNVAKNLIALPDNDEDEIYAGDYFPRRFPSENLSLEYLSFYKKEAGEKTIALVAGIYETEHSADSALAVLKSMDPAAFKTKADIYIGCIH